ncbi:MAG: hypothetical protein CSA35_04635 [Dethiosulfovibrio peptidovorans]|nr:MAG: hypothetical protein CSA35_04635 [Dethiosulfovibrio peptidovorans]
MDRLKWVISAVFLVTLLASMAWSSGASDGQVLVVLKNPFDEPLTIQALNGVAGRFYVAKVAWSVGARVVSVYQELSQAGGTVFALFESDISAEDLTAALRERPEVLAVSVNGTVQIQGFPENGAVTEDVSDSH